VLRAAVTSLCWQVNRLVLPSSQSSQQKSRWQVSIWPFFGQGGGTLEQVGTLWDRVPRFGPGFGYYPKPSKTILIVKQEKEEAAQALFEGSQVKITKKGHRDLGAFIGTKLATSGLFAEKIESWTRQVDLLAEIAKSQPHAAHAGYIHGLRSKWVFLQRVMAAIGTEMGPLEKAINEKLIPAILGTDSAVSELERSLFALPGRYSGLGFDDATKFFSTPFPHVSNHLEAAHRVDPHFPARTASGSREAKHVEGATKGGKRGCA
jgi:hypothetical protein